MNKKIKAEHTKSRLVVLVIFIMLITIVFINVFSFLLSAVDVSGYPKSTLMSVPVAFEGEYKGEAVDMLPFRVSCPTLPYAVNVPDNVDVKEDMLIGSFGEFDIIICESDKGVDEMLHTTLPTALNFPLLGNPHEVTEAVLDTGYFYNYQTDYVAAKVQTKVSVRSVTTYVFLYRLVLVPNRFLYLYVSTESEELLKGGKDLLDKIAFSVREVAENAVGETPMTDADDVGTGGFAEYEEDVQQTKPSAQLYRISLKKDMDWTFTDGIFVFEWMNVGTEPTELIAYGPNGEELVFLEEYSQKGHLVYGIGSSDAGTYVVEGFTSEPLSGVLMSLYEREDYETMFLDE